MNISASYPYYWGSSLDFSEDKRSKGSNKNSADVATELFIFHDPKAEKSRFAGGGGFIDRNLNGSTIGDVFSPSCASLTAPVSSGDSTEFSAS